ncbi:ATP-binding protein [Solobacterium moorei]|uniref:ATP-binding protein n=1 Tax=Solobacterium moorei TaxID=102148 RepID=UPI00040F3B12|nr:ATP-binding protein [Solobacterium moorei]BET21218.1 ATP-binding protein [Solobacterium moorei]
MGKYSVNKGIQFGKGIKTLIYGVEGVGKSTLASKFPKPIFLDTEGSTDKYNFVERYPKPTSIAMLVDECNDIVANGEYQTIVIDTFDKIEQMISEELCNANNKQSLEEFGYGAGYSELDERVGKLLNFFQDIIEKGINVTILAHARTKNFDSPLGDGSYTRYELKLGAKTTQRTASFLKEWADMILFCNYKVQVIENKDKKKHGYGGERCMYTTHSPAYDAKNRFGLDNELPLDFKAIEHIFKMNQSQSKNEQPIEVNLKPISEEKIAIEPKPTELNVETIYQPTAYTEDELKQMSLLPKALVDLMKADNVKPSEIMDFTVSKGIVTRNTPLKNYPDGYFDFLTTKWNEPLNYIKTQRELPY